MPKDIFRAAFDNDVKRIKEILKKHPGLVNASFGDPNFPYGGAAAWAGLAAKKVFGSFLFLVTAGALMVETGGAALLWGGGLGGAGAAAWNAGDRALVFNTGCRQGWTPLHFAAYGDAPEAAKLLIQSGANDQARDAKGRTYIGIVRKRLVGVRTKELFIEKCKEEITARAERLWNENNLQRAENQVRAGADELNQERQHRQDLEQRMEQKEQEVGQLYQNFHHLFQREQQRNQEMQALEQRVAAAFRPVPVMPQQGGLFLLPREPQQQPQPPLQPENNRNNFGH